MLRRTMTEATAIAGSLRLWAVMQLERGHADCDSPAKGRKRLELQKPDANEGSVAQHYGQSRPEADKVHMAFASWDFPDTGG